MLIETTAILLHTHKVQENGFLVSCFTYEYGLVKGFLRSQKQIKNVCIGSIIKITKKARLDSHIGLMTIEPHINVVGKIAFDQFKLLVLNSTVELIKLVLNENEPQPELFTQMYKIIEALSNNSPIKISKEYAIFEFTLLNSCGFGLDLSKCVVTNTTKNLSYISPKSGCAVSLDAGLPYHDKLFTLPRFISELDIAVSITDIINALSISQYFFDRHYLTPHHLKMPFIRSQLVGYITNASCDVAA